MLINEYSFNELLFAVTGSIEAKFPQDTFQFQTFPSGSFETVIYQEEPVKIINDKIKFILSTSAPGSAAITATSSYLSNPNTFVDQSESHEWRLNGLHKDTSNERVFYEDLRTDTIQSVVPHSFRNNGSLFRSVQFSHGNIRNAYDDNIGSKGASGIAGDPTTLSLIHI